MAIKTETIAIKVSAEEKELVRRLAAQEDQTVSKWLYNALIKHLEKEGK